MKKKLGGKLTEFYKSPIQKRAHAEKFIRRLKGTAMRPGVNEVEEFKAKKGKKP